MYYNFELILILSKTYISETNLFTVLIDAKNKI